MSNKRSKGRPATRPITLMDGFYIEVRNKGSKDKGIRIRNTTKQAMESAARLYGKNKDVVILGEMKNEKWQSEPINLSQKPAKVA